MEQYKTCTKCKIQKLPTVQFFYLDKKQSSGLKPECKECTLALKKIFYQANKDRLRLKAKAYREADPARWREIKKNYRKRNPEAVQNDRRKRTARKKDVPHKRYTAEQVIALYGSVCHLCNKPIDLAAPRWTALPGYEQGLHLDHVIRISEGGPDIIENIRPAHGICNQIKG